MDKLAVNWIPWALGSAFFAGLTAVLAKQGVAGVDSNLATGIRTVVILMLAWTIVWWTGVWKGAGEVSGKTLAFLVLSGLATGASWLCYFKALSLGPASKVAPVDKLSVVFVVLLSAVLLHESVSWKTGVGVVLLVCGALLIGQK